MIPTKNAIIMMTNLFPFIGEAPPLNRISEILSYVNKPSLSWIFINDKLENKNREGTGFSEGR